MCAEMIDHDGNLATSDAQISRNRTVSMDVSHESGIGSDSDSINGVDPTLTPSTPSECRWLNGHDPLLDPDDHTLINGHMTSAELSHLAERYPSDVPHDVVMNVRLEDEYQQYVTPPPPVSEESKVEVILTPEVDSKHFRSAAEKRPARRLPTVPSDATSDELPAQSRALTEPVMAKKMKDHRHEDSAELWKKAASVSSKDRATGHSAKTTQRSSQTAASVDQTGSRKDKTHARSADVVTTSGFQDVQEHRPRQREKTSAASSDVVTVSTLPRSRDRRQPISDVAPAVSNQQRVEVVKVPHTGVVKPCVNGEEHADRTLADDDRLTTVQRPDVTSLETFRPVQRGHERTQTDHNDRRRHSADQQRSTAASMSPVNNSKSLKMKLS